MTYKVGERASYGDLHSQGAQRMTEIHDIQDLQEQRIDRIFDQARDEWCEWWWEVEACRQQAQPEYE